MRNIIEASEGMILTNGEIYGSKIYLAEGLNEKDFKEITKEEHSEIMRKQELLEAQKYINN